MFEDLKEWVKERINPIVRTGLVSDVDGSSSTARVTFPDGDDVVTVQIPILLHGAAGLRESWLPEVGEQVVCLFLPHAPEQGFVVGSFYSPTQVLPSTVKAGLRILGGAMVALGSVDAAEDDDNGVVRKKDLQKAIDDVQSYVDDAVAGHVHGGVQTGTTAGGEYLPPTGPTPKTAVASSEVFAS